jgi:hypothetical protein
MGIPRGLAQSNQQVLGQGEMLSGAKPNQTKIGWMTPEERHLTLSFNVHEHMYTCMQMYTHTHKHTHTQSEIEPNKQEPGRLVGKHSATYG